MPELVDPTIATDELADLIRRWTATCDNPRIVAATTLLLEQEGWLHRDDFRRCIDYFPDEQMARIQWRTVKDLLDEGVRASSGEFGVLAFAAALALDEFEWASMGASHRAMLLRAVETALDQ